MRSTAEFCRRAQVTRGDWNRFRLCVPCLQPFQVAGPGATQRCTCRAVGDEPTWPGRDFNEHLHLCACCFGEALPSGSRWSVWFCAACKERVRRVNDELGSPLIPIGRHTLMHTLWLSAGDTVGMAGLFERTDWLDDHRRATMPDVLASVGLDGAKDVVLQDYLERVCAAPDEPGGEALFARLESLFLDRAGART